MKELPENTTINEKPRGRTPAEIMLSLKKFQGPITAVSIVIAVLLALLCFRYYTKAIALGTQAASSAFQEAKDAQADAAYQYYYDSGYDAAEARYHTSNQVSITVGSVQEQAKLEVLYASAVAYVTTTQDKVTSWLEATGSGVFTVNLAAGEYLIDNERSFVCVRVPKPELTSITIDDIQRLLYEDDRFIRNGSIVQGEDFAREQIASAEAQIKDDLSSNQRFYLSAENSAKAMIASLIRELNPDIEELNVEIEFIQ